MQRLIGRRPSSVDVLPSEFRMMRPATLNGRYLAVRLNRDGSAAVIRMCPYEP